MTLPFSCHTICIWLVLTWRTKTLVSSYFIIHIKIHLAIIILGEIPILRNRIISSFHNNVFLFGSEIYYLTLHYGIILNILVTSYFLDRIKIVILEELLYCEMNYFYPIMKNIAILLTAIHIWLLKRFKYALKIPNLMKTQNLRKF